MIEIKTKHYIEYTGDGISDNFYKGDSVVCCTKGKETYCKEDGLVKHEKGEEYRGRIIDFYTATSEDCPEPVLVVGLNTSKNAWSHSIEFIKINDIEFMCKDYLADVDTCKDMSDDELQKNTYIHVLSGMGYDRDKIENTWDSMEKLMKQFDISFEKAMSCVLYSLKNNCTLTVPLKNICGIDVESIEKSIPIYEKEAAKSLGMALVGGVCCLLADYLGKD